ncbi:LAGLIDADG family homing endonuclease [Micromonospora sp. Llam0]|uniref:LAGLIDADG family homing endonuclease n=1 Tax=Micromonospora sp. Llam0 TaxID=2485143 RepID=UPI003519EE61
MTAKTGGSGSGGTAKANGAAGSANGTAKANGKAGSANGKAGSANGKAGSAAGSNARVRAKAGAGGLTVERVWTSEGVHPYDEVTWQRRDVVMTNWRDGTVNFEQRGVEFPESWSVNAANIVTTKYFRGAVGTPQREWSLKQLIDRVVKTYRAAGEQHGYFATPGDAEIFEHELTWMLLHQVFSFNSPVWFNVGTASPQQVSACQPYHSLVSTPAGLVPIGKLVEENAVGAKVYDAHGLTRILAVQANGIKDVLRLHTKAGYTLDVTADHLVWKSTGEGTGRFVEAGTLVAGDTLEWHRRGSDGEAEFHPGDVHEAALAGWLQSDGFVGQYDQGTNRSLTIEAMTVNDDELSWVVAAIDQVFPGAHRHERRVVTQDVTLDCRRTRLYGKNLRPFIDKWGLLARGTEMEVPATLFTAPLPVVAAYLKSIFQAEGYVSAREASTLVGVDMIGERLIRGLQRLLLRFGIFARVGFKADPRPNRHGTWSLRIQNHGDRDTFAAEIGFVDARKSGKLEESFAKVGRSAKATKRLVIDRVEPLGAMEVYDIQTESGEYLSDNLRVHNCFILAVDDSMDSILDWYKEEGLIFKGGSGSGVNLSRIRSSKELLSSGGTASGPVSFMRGADASAGTIKSGGATRRAAKMVILDVDHPDIEEFVQTKAREEDKIRALRDAGFDMDLGGADIVSVQYQNANNSVRVSDEFMRAYEDGGNFDLRARLDGSVIDTVDAKKLFGTIAQAAWECADPGLQYDDTINDWHTCPESGRITASNPCFTGDTLVHTDKGLIRFDALIDRSRQGESFGVYTHDATNPDAPADQVVLTSPEAVMITGTNEITRLEFSNGMVLRCTPNHRIWTTNRGYVEAKDLTPDDQILPLNQPTPATAASWEFRMRADARVSPGDVVPTKWQRESRLPEKWTEDFAHLLGWLVGDGSVRHGTPGVRGDNPGASWIYSQSDPEAILQRHQTVLESIVGLRFDPVQMPNGTVQLRSNRTAVVDFLTGLGVSTARAVDKRLPSSVLEAPPEIQAAFLRGLFDADGCAAETANGTRYVGLGAVSIELLREAQRLLSGFGIGSRIYATRKAGDTTFRYTTNGGDEREYHGKQLYDLRISGENIRLFASRIGFDHQAKAQRVACWLEQHRFYRTDQTAKLVSREFDGFETTYNLSEPRNHSYIANGVVVRNCSEYLHLDNSSCNLASLNLMKFLRADGGFEVEKFVRSVEFVITAMDISICFADFPTQKIGETTRAYRQLGIGYANLGALLMASGLPYDSEAGRSYAAAITSVMTGTAYRRSAELAGVVGAYDGYARNAEGHKRVMRKHAAASDEIRPTGPTATALAREAARQWEIGNKIGEKNGWRNSQASVLAPTGCLTPDTMVTTDRGLMRLGEIGDVYGDRWQDLDMMVSTDEGARQATKFFVNGEEPTRRVVTNGGYQIQGTLAHRVKVVEPATGEWVWKRMAEVAPGDLVPVQLGTLVGEPRRVPLPVLDQAYYAGDRRLYVPDAVDAELAELVGYFMGDGSLHAKGLRFAVADTDLDVVERLRVLGKGLFGLEPEVAARTGYQEVVFSSVRLARWWQAAGFAKTLPHPEHTGKGWSPRVPSAILETNDVTVYTAFLRGLFEADGTVIEGVPSVSTSTESFAAEIRTLLLTLGMATTTRRTRSGMGSDIWQVRLRNTDHAIRYEETIGFIGARKAEQIVAAPQQTGNRDRIHLPRELWDLLVPAGHPMRGAVMQSLARTGGVSRTLAGEIYGEVLDDRLGHALGYLYETVTANEDGGVQPTYDLSVPANVTYVAGGFVSHNTIGLMMDCDTTGVEPDLALVKFKKLVGGGSMQIVNQTVPRALRSLGYPEEQVEAIVEHIADHGHVVDAPSLRTEHYPVFDCAMGERSIAPMGHVRMMAAVQPFISGAISKTVNMPESASVADVERIYFEGWKLGLKALAIYRDNCKVGQPLSAAKSDKAKETAAEQAKVIEKVVEKVVEYRPVRKRLPKKRPSETVSFSVGGAEGYLTASSYPDDGLGEVFLKMSKQGSTLAGVMDAFSVAISIGLQYGVPLETFVAKFTNMRFEPAGMTDDPDVRMAASVMDYIFRRLALDFLPYDRRAELGIFTAAERTAQMRAEAEAENAASELSEMAMSAPVEPKHPEASAPSSADSGSGTATEPAAASTPAPASVHSSTELLEAVIGKAADAPLCFTCGTKMRPAGSCYVCEGCGSTSGCS